MLVRSHQPTLTHSASPPRPIPSPLPEVTHPGLSSTAAVFYINIPPAAVLEQSTTSREVKLLANELNKSISATHWKGKRAGFVEVFASGSVSQISKAVAAANLAFGRLRKIDPIFASASGLGYWSGSGNGFEFRIYFYNS